VVASYDKDPTVRAEILRRYEFRRGFARRWISSTGTIVDLRLYQFSSPELARGFSAEDQLANGFAWGQADPIPEAPGGLTYARSTTDAHGYAQTLSTVLVGDVMVVLITSQLPPVQASIANRILAAEYSLLC